MADHTPTEFTIHVTEVVQETPLDRTLRLQVADAEVAAFAFEPGQYVCVWDPAVEEGPRRYFSISGGDPRTGTFQVTIRKSGEDEPPFYGSPAGLTLRTHAPAGTFVLAYEPGDELILIGGGSGITPFRSYVEALRRMNDAPRTTLVQSVRDPVHLVFQPELAAWAAEGDWLRYEPVVTGDAPDWDGRRGRLDQAALEALIAQPERTVLCACGPSAFVDAVLEAAQAAGVPPERCRREGW